MSLYDYLRQNPENIPAWLERFHPGDPFAREDFFASRVLFYPGAGTDGHPIKLFGSTHSVHTFVYADYSKSQNDLEAELEHPTNGFRGYHTLARLDLAERELVPHGWVPHVTPPDMVPHRHHLGDFPPFGFLEILERDEDQDDSHGPQRLAALFLGADGFAAYDALFCQESSVCQPFVVVLQDHGFGGNYDRFGQGGLLEQLANQCHVHPHSLLVAACTDPWDGYERVNVGGDVGGMNADQRFLYERIPIPAE